MELQDLSKTFKFDLQASKPVPEVIKANLALVLTLQHTDGGFKYWSSSRESDRWLSPYVAKLLARAEELHYDVPKARSSKTVSRTFPGTCAFVHGDVSRTTA